MMMCQRSISGVRFTGVGLGFGFGPGGCFPRFAALRSFTRGAGFAMLLAAAMLPRVSGAARFARAIMQLAERTAKGFDFAFVSELLALGKFDEFQDFLHLIDRSFERFDDVHHLVNCLADGSATVSRLGVRMTDALGEALDAFQ